MRTLPKILTNLLVTGVVASSALLISNAFFSDTETSSDNTFQAGELDLKIDNTSYYNGVLNDGTTWTEDNLPGHLFFNFNDLKPGDWGEDTISLHVQNPAWACLKLTTAKNDDNTCTEPELLPGPGNDPSCAESDEDLFDGELGKFVHIIFWPDDGDNVLETDEFPHALTKKGPLNNVFDGQAFTLTDSGSSIWPTPGPIPADQIVYIGKAWCFGQIGVAPVPQGQGVNPTIASGITCDGAPLENAAQTDIFTGDFEFTAIQSRHNDNYLCNDVPTDTPACIEGFATAVELTDQGVRKDGSAVTADRSVGAYALGAPQSTGTPYDNPVVPDSFFSLGFPTQTKTASIVLRFSPIAVNGPGNDLKLYEVTGGTSYPDEKVKVEIAGNIAGPWSILSNSATRDAEFDFGLLPGAKYVRITDVSNIADFEDTADGYDLDAVKAFCIKQIPQ